MHVRDLLASKGYNVETRNLDMHWLCVLEWHNQIRNFSGASEDEAVQRAARYVAEMEAGFEEQRLRMLCEGCE